MGRVDRRDRARLPVPRSLRIIWARSRSAAFDAWVGLYGDGAEKQPSGIYIKKLHSASGVIKPPVEYDWIQLDYTGRIMVDGDVFVTRDSAVAVEQGTFEYFYALCAPNDSVLRGRRPASGSVRRRGYDERGGSRFPGIRSLYARLRQLRPVVLPEGIRGRYRAFRPRRLSSWIWS